MYFLLVLAAWGSLFLPMPRWASVLASCVCLALGAILLMAGLGGSYWDSHMTPRTSAATSTLVTGVLILLSRTALIVKVVLHALVAPSAR